jgi:hypothetical protein
MKQLVSEAMKKHQCAALAPNLRESFFADSGA